MRALALLLMLAAPPADAACRQALVLALDISGSVDAEEYRLQVEGLASALGSAEVRQALLGPGAPPVRLAVYQWSGPGSQALILPWAEIGDGPALDAAIGRIRNARRGEVELSTAIGAALASGFALLDDQGECWQRTLDVSGDGPSNSGPQPQIIRDRFRPDDVTVNGLVVGQIPRGGDDRAEDVRQLAAYFAANVTGGAGAFVEMAFGYEDYETAMRRKLLRELASLAVGALPEARLAGGRG